jgi:predicted nucleic acid-binding protein
LDQARAAGLLAEAEARVRTVNVPPARAFAVACEFSISAYDARFIAAAQLLQSPLVSEDAKLRAAAPALTVSIAEALRA